MCGLVTGNENRGKEDCIRETDPVMGQNKRLFKIWSMRDVMKKPLNAVLYVWTMGRKMNF